MATIRLKRGLEKDLPPLLKKEMAYCTDSNNVYIGTSDGIALVGM